jgi:hypothetical protein
VKGVGDRDKGTGEVAGELAKRDPNKGVKFERAS